MLSCFFEGVDELLESWNLSVQDQVLSQKNEMATYSLCPLPMSFVMFCTLIPASLYCSFFATFDHCPITFDTLGPIVPYIGGY